MLAVLYDVHGNLDALQAVLRDASAAGADRFVLGGDYAAWGPFPQETVLALRELGDAVWIRGNADRWIAHPDQAPAEVGGEAINAYREALGPTLVDELGALPEQAVVDGVRYCHASPMSDICSFSAATQTGEELIPSIMASATSDRELLAGARERMVVFGHTHIQFRRPGPDGIELVNPGSVGMPLDGDRRAAYALVDDEGQLELRRVEYDFEATIADIRRRFGDAPWVDISVARMRNAGIDEHDPLRRLPHTFPG